LSGALPARVYVAGKAEVGSTAPDFELSKLSGARVRLSDLRGHAVIVTFYASWCNPCRDELPLLNTFARAHSRSVRVVGVSYKDLRADARSLQRDLKISFPMLFDPSNRVAKVYGVVGIPQTFYIDREGVIRYRVFGPTTKSAVERRIAKLR
jgi:peroxiredoxin